MARIVCPHGEEHVGFDRSIDFGGGNQFAACLEPHDRELREDGAGRGVGLAGNCGDVDFGAPVPRNAFIHAEIFAKSVGEAGSLL